MPILRRDIRQSSFARKLHSYADTQARRLHTDAFGISNFRVLTVTTSPERVASMRNAVHNEIADSAPLAQFLFRVKTDPASMLKWQTAGETTQFNCKT